jgi:hypothetical protein
LQIEQLINDKTKDQKFAYIRLMQSIFKEPIVKSVESAIKMQRKTMNSRSLSTRDQFVPFEKRQKLLEQKVKQKLQVEKSYTAV